MEHHVVVKYLKSSDAAKEVLKLIGYEQLQKQLAMESDFEYC